MDATELTRVVKNKREIFLIEDEVVVPGGNMIGGRDAQFAGHAEVQPEPEILGETEEHLFSGGFGADKFLAGEFRKKSEVIGAEDAFFAVDMDAENFGIQAGIPLAAVVIDLGEFGHVAVLNADLEMSNESAKSLVGNGNL